MANDEDQPKQDPAQLSKQALAKAQTFAGELDALEQFNLDFKITTARGTWKIKAKLETPAEQENQA